MPLYMQLAERMIAAIRNGPADRAGLLLPSETELTTHLGISRPTVRQAMAHLVAMGLVARRRGRGTFVASKRFSHDVRLAFEDEMRDQHRHVSFRLLARKRIVPGPAIADRLGLARGVEIEFVERLRLVDGEAFAHEQRFFEPALAARLTTRQLQERAIITLLADALGEPPARIANIIRSIPADEPTARLLELPPGQPLLETEHTYYDRANRPLVHGIVRFSGARFEFVLDSPIAAVPAPAAPSVP